MAIKPPTSLVWTLPSAQFFDHHHHAWKVLQDKNHLGKKSPSTCHVQVPLRHVSFNFSNYLVGEVQGRQNSPLVRIHHKPFTMTIIKACSKTHPLVTSSFAGCEPLIPLPWSDRLCQREKWTRKWNDGRNLQIPMLGTEFCSVLLRIGF